MSCHRMTARQAYSHLLALGYNGFDAYDMLSDSGYDPHPGASETTLTVDELVACAVRFFGGAA